MTDPAAARPAAADAVTDPLTAPAVVGSATAPAVVGSGTVEPAGGGSGPKTIDEIAGATGVSRTTVRFVVAGLAERYRIKPETRERIEAYVAAHGLALNHAARSLKLRRSEAVGLVVPDLANAFFAGLTAALEDHCRRNGLVLLTASSHEDPAREALAVENLVARGVDGLVVAPCRPATAFRGLRRRGCAVVMVDRAFPATPFPTVVGDNEAAARQLAERLLALGHPVDFLCACPTLPSIADRIRGFTSALRAAGHSDVDTPIHRAETDDVAAGARVMTALAEARGDAPSTFMCSSLLVLEGALQAIVARCGRLPSDTVIGTFDHHPLLDVVPNRILTIRQDEAAIAARAFACLSDLMAGAAPSALHHVIPGRLWERGPATAPER